MVDWSREEWLRFLRAGAYLAVSLNHLSIPGCFLTWALLTWVQTFPGVLKQGREVEVGEEKRGHNVELPHFKWNLRPKLHNICTGLGALSKVFYVLCFWKLSKYSLMWWCRWWVPESCDSPTYIVGMEYAHSLILNMCSVSLQPANLDFWHRVTVGLYCGSWYSLPLFAFPSGNWSLKPQNAFLATHT